MDNNFFTSQNSNIFDFNQSNLQEKEQNSQNNSINAQYDNLKNNYEQIFIEAAESIRREVNKFKPENPCTFCSKKKECKIEEADVFSPYPANCSYREWQMQIITYLCGDYRQKLKAAYKAIMDKKCEYSCNQCGDCCRLATSEYSYNQLKQRAMRGDKFSADFIKFSDIKYAAIITPKQIQMTTPTMIPKKIFNESFKCSCEMTDIIFSSMPPKSTKYIL